eukprot:1164320-Prymnesium_polylepis.2
MPDGPRKSGTPAAVETPAPISTTRWFADRTLSQRASRERSRRRPDAWTSGSPHAPLLLYAFRRAA